MRVVAGKYKGFNLLSPKVNSSRPTDNKVKEAIFDMLFPYKPDFVALDLFSGTGQMGIEFLSRGAREVYFNDKNPSTNAILKENISKIKDDSAKISKLDFRKALKYYKEEKLKFDYIFLDPPYEGDMLKQAIELIIECELLNDEGIIITESDRELDFSGRGGLNILKEKSYGRKLIKIYTRNESDLSR